MGKNRLEAFSDGVLAIVITIMVLELKAPHAPEMSALKPLVPPFLSYVLSFVYVGIYWNNHHHLLHVADRVSGAILWSNLHLLFWLSLIPFATHWMGESHFAAAPVAIYGTVLLLAAVAYWILERAILAQQGPRSVLARAMGRDVKGNLSVVLYVVAILLAFPIRWAAEAIYVGVALMWLVPDRRIEKALAECSQVSAHHGDTERSGP